MIAYASMTTTRRNRAVLAAHDWRWLITPDSRTWDPGQQRWAIDNGKWRAFIANIEWNEARFIQLVVERGGGADFIVVPDIVAGGLESLSLSVEWAPRLRALCPTTPLYLAVQDGMSETDVAGVIDLFDGVFVGGTTEWKVATIPVWGDFARQHGKRCHVGRVNTQRRIRICADAGVDSFDGSSGSVFSDTVAPLDQARRALSLINWARAA